jgi:hypothetical protein
MSLRDQIAANAQADRHQDPVRVVEKRLQVPEGSAVRSPELDQRVSMVDRHVRVHVQAVMVEGLLFAVWQDLFDRGYRVALLTPRDVRAEIGDDMIKYQMRQSIDTAQSRAENRHAPLRIDGPVRITPVKRVADLADVELVPWNEGQVQATEAWLDAAYDAVLGARARSPSLG